MSERDIIGREDYEETSCPFCTPDEVTPIPLGRIIDKLDEYLFAKDFDGAERHLEYWIREADASYDMRGKLSLYNEMIGLYRKLGKLEKAMFYISGALELAEITGLNDTITMGTTLENAATALKSFGDFGNALRMYDQAREIYEKYLPKSDERLGGLYNNMALALTDSGEYQKAMEMFEKALDIMSNVEDSQPEVAITYCNLASLIEAWVGVDDPDGRTRIDGYLNEAVRAFRDCTKRDENFAYACEKCAQVLDYFGLDELGCEISGYARSVYEGN